MWLAFAVFVFFAWPANLGGSTGYAIVSGTSMEPTMRTGDLVITRKKSSYDVGDVVVYRVPKGDPGEGKQVIHRIVEADTGDGYVLLGDNRTSVDFWRPHDSDIVGVETFHIPQLGRILVLLRGPLGWGLAAGVLTTLAVLAPSTKDPADRVDDIDL